MIPCGILPPLITPLLGDDQLDAAGLERLVEHVLAGGVHGLFLLGTTGEGPSLSYRLRREIIERLRALVVRRGDLYRIGQPHACSGLKGIKCALSLKGICRDLVAAPLQPFERHPRQSVRRFLDDVSDDIVSLSDRPGVNRHERAFRHLRRVSACHR